MPLLKRAPVQAVSRKPGHLQPAADAINQNGARHSLLLAMYETRKTLKRPSQRVEYFGKIDGGEWSGGKFSCKAESDAQWL